MTGTVPHAPTTEPPTLTVLRVNNDTFHLILGDQWLSSVLGDQDGEPGEEQAVGLVCGTISVLQSREPRVVYRDASALRNLDPDEVDMILTDLIGRHGEPGLECYPPVR